jgi:hypothetical protein
LSKACLLAVAAVEGATEKAIAKNEIETVLLFFDAMSVRHQKP